jgi:shikimate dehydrogenase
MLPKSEATPITQEYLRNFSVVMDIVYAPQETRLLKEAAAQGCQTISGLAMLLFQGAAQFELWTGKKAPLAVMRQQLLAGLSINAASPREKK